MNEFVTYTQAKRYRVYVTWVDHGSFVKDNNTVPALSNLSLETGRNFHVMGFRLDGTGDPFKYNILIPQELQGSFKLPQIGDVITVEENYRELGSSPVYIYSTYNDFALNNYISSPIPAWGSMPGDYGHLRSHADHTNQFLTQANADFSKRYIKSITGYRFRKYYGHVYGTQERFLEKGKFVVRGDNVFDITQNDSLMSNAEIKTEEGMDIVSTKTNSLDENQANYPNPLNVPKVRQKDDRYSYVSNVAHPLDKQIEGDVYLGAREETNPVGDVFYKNILKTKNYFSYQPIVDKKYFEYLKNFPGLAEGNSPQLIERELPAAEEYQVALRGNNKLLIQDQYGDGEQILITLKNQYDAGFTVIHNVENGQVRIRDHLGQGVLLEANPDAPRVVTWTTERQVIDMGSIRAFNFETGETEAHGEYIYLRNGNVYGKSDTSFGRIPDSEIQRNEVPQQEFALINAKDASGFSKLMNGISSRFSSGMNTLVSASTGNGLFFRNNYDPKSTNQTLSMFNDYSSEPILTTKIYQEHQGGDVQSYLEHVVTDSSSESEVFNKKSNSSMTTTTRVDDSNSQTNVTNVFGGTTRNTFKMDKDTMISTQYTAAGVAANKIEQIAAKINIQRLITDVDITLTGKNVKIQGEAVDIEEI